MMYRCFRTKKWIVFGTKSIFYWLYNARTQSVAIGDINNDDMLDIVVANYGTNYVEILLQTC